METEKMIEDLGHTLYCKQDKFDLSNPFEVAKAVIEEGCIKIPEGAIVIDKDYLNLLKQTVAAHTRKETARELLEWLVDHTFENAIIKTYFKEQFGVEVEE